MLHDVRQDLVASESKSRSVGLRREVSVEKSLHYGWLKDESSYRCILRADGHGKWSRAVTPKNGDTLSWCVTLAERV